MRRPPPRRRRASTPPAARWSVRASRRRSRAASSSPGWPRWSRSCAARALGTMTDPRPASAMLLLAALCWLGAERAAFGARHLVWPASAFGIAGRSRSATRAADATPELREGRSSPPRGDLHGLGARDAALPVPLPAAGAGLADHHLRARRALSRALRHRHGAAARGRGLQRPRHPRRPDGEPAGMRAVFGVLAAGGAGGRAASRPEHRTISGSPRRGRCISSARGVVALVAGRLAALLPGPWPISRRSPRSGAGHGLDDAGQPGRGDDGRASRAGQAADPRRRRRPSASARACAEWTILIGAIGPRRSRSGRPASGCRGAGAGRSAPAGRVPPDRPGFGWRYWPYATGRSSTAGPPTAARRAPSLLVPADRAVTCRASSRPERTAP